MQFQSAQLFTEWVRSEFYHFATLQPTHRSSNSQQEWSEEWTQLVDNGFVYWLFEQIDGKYFWQHLSQRDEESDVKVESLVREYWTELDKYMQLKQHKKINPTYLSQHTSQKKQLTSRQYSRTSNSSLQNSISQLVKMQFYLLVQKYNSANIEQGIEEGNQQKMSWQLDETLESSQLIKAEGEESVRSSLNQDKESQASGMRSSLTEGVNSEMSGSQVLIIGSLRNDHGEERQQKEGDNKFLQRICELSQQVQQQLVAVVQQIEQRQLIHPLHIYDQSNQALTQSVVYTNQPTTPTDSFKKIIYRQIQQVSEQNQQLKEKIEQIIEENLKLQKQLEDNHQQQAQLTTKINNYTYEKEQLFYYLKNQHHVNINSLEEFIQIVEHIQHENSLLQNTIAHIQQRNYDIETDNAQKIHAINKNALQITQVNEDITKFKSKIHDLKQDIDYLDEFVNGNTLINNAQLIRSIRIEQFHQNDLPENYDQSDSIHEHDSSFHEQDSSFAFTKSIDLQARHSFGPVLRENLDIFNQKVTSKTNAKPTHNRILTDSITGPNRSSLRKISHKKQNKSSFPPKDQENIDPTPFEQDELKLQSIPHYQSSSLSRISINHQLQQEQRLIEEEKQKYKQELVNSLEQLYKQINDLTTEVTQAKEDNKLLDKKNRHNQKKISQLKTLHQTFLKQAQRT